MSPSKTQPALLGGVAMGVLSALPVINLANCCCAWIIFGGALAAYLMQQNHPEPITVGDGAIVGLLSGIIGAFVWAVVSIPLSSAMSGFQSQILEQVMADSSDVPPEVRELLQTLGTGGAVGIASLIGLVFMLCIGSAFGLLGGILGALAFRKKPPSAPPTPPNFSPPPGQFGSQGGHTFTPPTFNPPPPPGSSGS